MPRAPRAPRASRAQEQEQSCAGPNDVWHHGSQHKLFNYGIVVHGFVDEYTRLVTGLKASSNNRGTTMLRLFRDGPWLLFVIPRGPLS
jgi:hypothetical protein